MQRVNFESEFDSENMRGGMFTNLVRGYIHPLRDTSSESDPIRVSLSVSTGTGTLQISTDDTPGHLVSQPQFMNYILKEKKTYCRFL